MRFYRFYVHLLLKYLKKVYVKKKLGNMLFDSFEIYIGNCVESSQ